MLLDKIIAYGLKNLTNDTICEGFDNISKDNFCEGFKNTIENTNFMGEFKNTLGFLKLPETERQTLNEKMADFLKEGVESSLPFLDNGLDANGLLWLPEYVIIVGLMAVVIFIFTSNYSFSIRLRAKCPYWRELLIGGGLFELVRLAMK